MFKWGCLAFAVVSLSLLTWELRRMREEIDRSRPTFTLEGEVDNEVAHGISINYHPPFASPPRLTFPEGHSGWQITVQNADSFGVNRDTSGAGNTRKFKWKAEGQPAKTKVEVLNEAILRELQGLQREVRNQNQTILRELQGLRQDMKKRIDGDGKK